MRDQSGTDTQAVIMVRMERFELMTRVLGCESDTARAELIDVHVRTISRARESGGVVGATFVANALVSFMRHEKTLKALNLVPTFDALFFVAEIPRGSNEAAA